jgi:hypothetical protein
MHERRIPEWLRHAPAPSVRGFAMLAGAEAMARGILISVFVRRSVLYSGRTRGRTITSHHPRADIGASAAKAHFDCLRFFDAGLSAVFRLGATVARVGKHD